MQMRVIAIPPTSELANLAPVATDRLTAASPTALREEAFDQQRVAPENGSGCCCVEHAADKGKRLCLVPCRQEQAAETCSQKCSHRVLALLS